MSGIIESPFLKLFATTNTILLGTGALYLVSSGRESRLSNTYREPKVVDACKKHRFVDERQDHSESHGNLYGISTQLILKPCNI